MVVASTLTLRSFLRTLLAGPGGRVAVPHFIISVRILKRFHNTQQSYPQLPDLSTRQLWEFWDAALELAIQRLV